MSNNGRYNPNHLYSSQQGHGPHGFPSHTGPPVPFTSSQAPLPYNAPSLPLTGFNVHHPHLPSRPSFPFSTEASPAPFPRDAVPFARDFHPFAHDFPGTSGTPPSRQPSHMQPARAFAAERTPAAMSQSSRVWPGHARTPRVVATNDVPQPHPAQPAQPTQPAQPKHTDPQPTSPKPKQVNTSQSLSDRVPIGPAEMRKKAIEAIDNGYSGLSEYISLQQGIPVEVIVYPTTGGSTASGRKRRSRKVIKYGCPFPGCKSKIIGRAGLTRHIRVHTGETPYVCKTCKKSFRQQGSLKSHMRVHTGNLPFPCPACGEGFNHPGSVYKHQKRGQCPKVVPVPPRVKSTPGDQPNGSDGDGDGDSDGDGDGDDKVDEDLASPAPATSDPAV